MASGDTLLIFHPYNNEPTSTIYATLDTRNQHPLLDFDPTTDEEAVFSSVMPQHYAGTTGVTVYIHFAMSTATSAGVVWQATFESTGNQFNDLDTTGFGTLRTSGAVTVPAISGYVKTATIAFTDGSQMDEVATGEAFRLKIRRDADSTSATDDATGDAELLKVEIRET